MKLISILSLLAAIALLASCAQTEVKLPPSKDKLVSGSQTQAPPSFVQYPDDRPSIAAGKSIFERSNCASCHGQPGAGGTARALANKKLLTLKKPVELYQLIKYGNGPGHAALALRGSLVDREIWNLVFYTRSLAVPPLSAAEIAQIDPVFGSNCAVCHGTKGDGEGPLARNLEPSPANFMTFRRFYDRSDDLLYDHIANGIKWEGMPGFLGKQDRRKNFKFDEENINKLVQYVRHFHVSGEGASIVAAPPAGPKADSLVKAESSPPPAASPELLKYGEVSKGGTQSLPGKKTE